MKSCCPIVVRCVAIGVLTLCWTMSARADSPGYHFSKGMVGVVFPVGPAAKHLVLQRISLQLTPLGQTLLDDNRVWRLSASYRLRNRSGKTIEAIVAQPESADREVTCTGDDLSNCKTAVKRAVGGLIAKVDGTTPISAGKLAPKALLTPLRGRHYDRYVAWKVRFRPLQARVLTLTMRYRAYHNEHETPVLVVDLRPASLWQGGVQRTSLTIDFRDNACVSVFQAPGGNCIESFSREVEVTDFANARFRFPATVDPNLKLAGATLTRKQRLTQLHWAVNGLPRRKLEIFFDTASSVRRALLAAIGKLKLAGQSKTQLTLARWTLLALAGMTLTPARWRVHFAGKSWYVVDPSMTLRRLPASVRAPLARIDRVLKQKR